MTDPEAVVVRLVGDRTAVAVRPTGPPDLDRAVGALALGGPRPVVAVVGGAGLLDPSSMDELRGLFAEAIAPVIRECDAIAVDGGTDSGVMRLLGRARAAGTPFPLVGVAAAGMVSFPGHPGPVPLEENHSHFVLVPGDEWGDEAPYLAMVASALAGGRPSVTVLVNGGEIALADVLHSVAQDRPVLVLGGTGRTADRIAAAAADPAGCGDSPAVSLAHSPLVRVVDATNRTATAAALRATLTP